MKLLDLDVANNSITNKNNKAFTYDKLMYNP